LILRKISKIGATGCQILRLKCTKFDFRDPAGGAYSASPDPLAVFKGLLLRGGREKGGREGEGKERGGEGRGELAPNWGVWIRQWYRGGHRGRILLIAVDGCDNSVHLPHKKAMHVVTFVITNCCYQGFLC